MSNGNAYSEAWFRTAKYAPGFSAEGSASLEAARKWVLAFERWYTEEHRHGGIRYVTPGEALKPQRLPQRVERPDIAECAAGRELDKRRIDRLGLLFAADDAAQPAHDRLDLGTDVLEAPEIGEGASAHAPVLAEGLDELHVATGSGLGELDEYAHSVPDALRMSSMIKKWHDSFQARHYRFTSRNALRAALQLDLSRFRTSELSKSGAWDDSR